MTCDLECGEPLEEIRGERAGFPIRVNGATLWWAWPARLGREDAIQPPSVLLMGKNLNPIAAAAWEMIFASLRISSTLRPARRPGARPT